MCLFFIQFLKRVGHPELIDDVIDFVVSGQQFTVNETVPERSMCSKTPREIVVGSYQHLVAACNKLEVFEVSQ